MRKVALALVIAISLSSLAMAGDLSSSDSQFLFSNGQAAATVISGQEMQSTQGQLLGLGGLLTPLLGGLLPTLAPILGLLNSVPLVGGLVTTILALLLS